MQRRSVIVFLLYVGRATNPHEPKAQAFKQFISSSLGS